MSGAILSQLLLGLINGSFYALLSLGLALIFGLMKIVNFAHGVLYALGAFAAWLLLDKAGLGYGWALVLAPLAVGGLSAVIEITLIRRLRHLDPLYGLLLTFGLAILIQELLRMKYGNSGQPYPVPGFLRGADDLGFMFLPRYRAWVITVSVVVCTAVWLIIEKTRLGSTVRAAAENPRLLEAFGVAVPRLMTATYAFGGALAAFAGVLAAPIYRVSPLMGSDLIIVVFAVVAVGGMGSIGGSILTGFALGIAEGFTKVFYPQASTTVIFVIMALVLLVRPRGLFGRAA
ncbi:MAG TPA: branched-chain amino acid ABC transporter permease [Kofleriaceae bacterium]|nr:branched-chain amino acid ABC transporter permease [Kofleriaceae bacterium]